MIKRVKCTQKRRACLHATSQMSVSDAGIRLRCTGTAIASLVTSDVSISIISSNKQRLHCMRCDVIMTPVMSSLLGLWLYTWRVMLLQHIKHTHKTWNKSYSGGGLAYWLARWLRSTKLINVGPGYFWGGWPYPVQFPVRDIYLGVWPATQVNSAWPSLR